MAVWDIIIDLSSTSGEFEVLINRNNELTSVLASFNALYGHFKKGDRFNFICDNKKLPMPLALMERLSAYFLEAKAFALKPNFTCHQFAYYLKGIDCCDDFSDNTARVSLINSLTSCPALKAGDLINLEGGASDKDLHSALYLGEGLYFSTYGHNHFKITTLEAMVRFYSNARFILVNYHFSADFNDIFYDVEVYIHKTLLPLASIEEKGLYYAFLGLSFKTCYLEKKPSILYENAYRRLVAIESSSQATAPFSKLTIITAVYHFLMNSRKHSEYHMSLREGEDWHFSTLMALSDRLPVQTVLVFYQSALALLDDVLFHRFKNALLNEPLYLWAKRQKQKIETKEEALETPGILPLFTAFPLCFNKEIALQSSELKKQFDESIHGFKLPANIEKKLSLLINNFTKMNKLSFNLLKFFNVTYSLNHGLKSDVSTYNPGDFFLFNHYSHTQGTEKNRMVGLCLMKNILLIFNEQQLFIMDILTVVEKFSLINRLYVLKKKAVFEDDNKTERYHSVLYQNMRLFKPNEQLSAPLLYLLLGMRCNPLRLSSMTEARIVSAFEQKSALVQKGGDNFVQGQIIQKAFSLLMQGTFRSAYGLRLKSECPMTFSELMGIETYDNSLILHYYHQAFIFLSNEPLLIERLKKEACYQKAFYSTIHWVNKISKGFLYEYEKYRKPFKSNALSIHPILYSEKMELFDSSISFGLQRFKKALMQKKGDLSEESTFNFETVMQAFPWFNALLEFEEKTFQWLDDTFLIRQLSEAQLNIMCEYVWLHRVLAHQKREIATLNLNNFKKHVERMVTHTLFHPIEVSLREEKDKISLCFALCVEDMPYEFIRSFLPLEVKHIKHNGVHSEILVRETFDKLSSFFNYYELKQSLDALLLELRVESSTHIDEGVLEEKGHYVVIVSINLSSSVDEKIHLFFQRLLKDPIEVNAQDACWQDKAYLFTLELGKKLLEALTELKGLKELEKKEAEGHIGRYSFFSSYSPNEVVKEINTQGLSKIGGDDSVRDVCIPINFCPMM